MGLFAGSKSKNLANFVQTRPQQLSPFTCTNTLYTHTHHTTPPHPTPPAFWHSIMEEYDVVIIGSGVAGLTAARHLVDVHGVSNLVIVEAADYVGGYAYPPHAIPQHFDGTCV